MSSSVSYAYTVRREALRRERERERDRERQQEREREAAADALRAALRRHEEVAERARSLRAVWGEEIAVPAQREEGTDTADAASLRAARATVERETASARERLDQQVKEARVATVRAGMAALGGEERTPVDAATALAEQQQRDAEQGERRQRREVEEEVEATVARLVGRLAAEVPAPSLARVEDAVGAAQGAGSPAQREQAISALRMCVQEANAEAARAAAEVLALKRLEERLDGHRGPEAGAARALLATARSGAAMAAAAEAAVEAAVVAEEQRAKASYVARQLGRVLGEMGYEVGPEFSTTLASAGEALALRPEWGGYAVAVRCAGDPARLEFDVVRGAATRADQAARDFEVESEFCATRPRMLDELARAGVDASQVRLVEAGSESLRIEPGLVRGRREEAAERAREREA